MRSRAELINLILKFNRERRVLVVALARAEAGRIGPSHRAHWASADLPAEQDQRALPLVPYRSTRPNIAKFERPPTCQI
jgi:hypothetical protein